MRCPDEISGVEGCICHPPLPYVFFSPPPIFLSLSLPLSLFSYDLVRHLQGLINSHLSPLLTRKLGSLSLEGDGHVAAALLTEDLLASAQ